MSNREPQATVRRGQLERYMARVMDEFRDEMAKGTARTIAEYHTILLEPRLRWLEMPWWKRPFVRLGEAWARVRAKKLDRAKAVAIELPRTIVETTEPPPPSLELL